MRNSAKVAHILAKYNRVSRVRPWVLQDSTVEQTARNVGLSYGKVAPVVSWRLRLRN